MRLKFLWLALAIPASAAQDGRELYHLNCSMCHGSEGLGMSGTFPPLAQSDFLIKEREKALRGPLEGLSGPIHVNGQSYNGAMPPAFLDDEQLAAVFNFVFSAWGNSVKATSAEEIAALRKTTKFPTLADLKRSMVSDQLPAAPEGWQLSVGAELAFTPSRITLHPDGKSVLALAENGDVWQWKTDGKQATQLFKWQSYLDANLGAQLVMGLGTDDKGRLYITSNQRNKSKTPVQNEMTIFRSEPWEEGQPLAAPKPWLRTHTPFGIGPYNHGLSHIAQGPDGLLYLNSGARTDSGEQGNQEGYSKDGETGLTSTMWRVDPESAQPAIEIFAKGLRNSYGFCWDDEKRMIATENGPDADAPEELNLVEKGKHYGFPFKYSDFKDKPYPHTPDLPAGLEITLPFRNLGPDAGGNTTGMASFDPHSCPAGIVWLGKDWPAPLGASFITARFGNMLKLKGGDVGYDVQQLRVDFTDRTLKSTTLLAPLGRPIDVLKLPGHRLVIAEYSRATSLEGGVGTTGRLLVLEPKSAR